MTTPDDDAGKNGCFVMVGCLTILVFLLAVAGILKLIWKIIVA